MNVHLKVMDLSITWNCRYWSQINLHWLIEIDHKHKWKINVWCGIIGSRIIGPIFFQETLNADRYSVLIETDLFVLLKTLPLRLDIVVVPTRRMSVAYIESCPYSTMFPNKWIGKYGPINYPPRSSDLTILDYYLWGRVKDLVYRERSITRDDMIHRISEAI